MPAAMAPPTKMFRTLILPTHTESPTDEKQALRRRALALRATAHAAHPTRSQEAGTALAETFCHALADRLADSAVALYWPMRDEIDVRPLIIRLAEMSVRTALPVMTGATDPLTFRVWVPGDTLVAAAFGVQEPAASAPRVIPDIVAAPLLAFDAAGHRLGYGGGYYDRTLRDLRSRGKIVAAGIAYDEQEFAVVPVHTGDEILDMVITDQRVVVARK